MAKNIQRRADFQPKRQSTKIWHEQPSAHNPYIASKVECYGFNFIELIKKRSYADVLFLLLRGELPSPEQELLLEKLMIALINPGPRHPATRAVVSAAVSKTLRQHMLPIGTQVIGGDQLGVQEVEHCMRFIAKNSKHSVESLNLPDLETPGFRSSYGSSEQLPGKYLVELAQLQGAGTSMLWAQDLDARLGEHNRGITMPGLAAASLLDLGFRAKEGGVLYQLLCGPGLLAHGLEYHGRALTDLPFPSDEDYTIERDVHD